MSLSRSLSALYSLSPLFQTYTPDEYSFGFLKNASIPPNWSRKVSYLLFFSLMSKTSQTFPGSLPWAPIQYLAHTLHAGLPPTIFPVQKQPARCFLCSSTTLPRSKIVCSSEPTDLRSKDPIRKTIARWSRPKSRADCAEGVEPTACLAGQDEKMLNIYMQATV